MPVERTPEQTLYAVSAELPDSYSDSKDWTFDTDPVSRIRWLKTQLAAAHELTEQYEEFLVRDRNRIDELVSALLAAQAAMKQVVKNVPYRHKDQIEPLFEAFALIQPLCESVAETSCNSDKEG